MQVLSTKLPPLEHTGGVLGGRVSVRVTGPPVPVVVIAVLVNVTVKSQVGDAVRTGPDGPSQRHANDVP